MKKDFFFFCIFNFYEQQCIYEFNSFLRGDFEQHTLLQTLNKMAEKNNTSNINVYVCVYLFERTV